jgi:hypothetical protein
MLTITFLIPPSRQSQPRQFSLCFKFDSFLLILLYSFNFLSRESFPLSLLIQLMQLSFLLSLKFLLLHLPLEHLLLIIHLLLVVLLLSLKLCLHTFLLYLVLLLYLSLCLCTSNGFKGIFYGSIYSLYSLKLLFSVL